MGLLAALVALACIYAPVLTVCGAEACSSFRDLENGRTFFRYGGLLVTFRCLPGYKLHGHKTNSCVSGRWSRDPPVCVDINECREKICEWRCVNLPGSHRCICPRGYILQKDGRRYINECSQKNGGCSHLCVNQKGGYKCACPASHRLSSYSWKKCQPRTTAKSAG
ncbi:fibulin-5-like isoform X2 [Anabas testudineus]|uniref:fibulin-5-like isoform X2 n=1 Tax=Anabas testudineus TaxID=64144 RepID=UPI000E460196|nr:fibulin-5-like isoform X2 [Anabas testudineus]